MRNTFWLIQRGKLNKEGGSSLLGRDGVVNLDYMGSAEFEFGAIPYAFWRMMYNFEEYTLFDSEVDVVGKRRLLVFGKKSNQDKIANAIQDFVREPYHLKEYSDLDNLARVADISKPWTICHTRFWWCIDRDDCGEWMAFLEEDSEKIYSAIQYDYQNWWLAKSEEEREEMYKRAKSRW